MPSFRGKPACSCLVAWLVAYERELKRRGVIKESLDVYQLIGAYSKSGGTHALGGAYDVAQCDDVSLEVASQMGSASWHRTPAQGFIHHQHGVLNGCPHAASPAKGQVVDRANGHNGLVGKYRAADHRPWPGRTWQQGIAWAADQARGGEVVSAPKTVHLSDPYLTESSWLALSQIFPGLAYTGNDETGHLCTIDLATGNTVGTFAVAGMKLVDPESADVHHGALWVADIGDNDATRKEVVLYVMAEPGKGNKGAIATERYRARYSNGPRNAEAFFIHPITGHRYIISKEASGNLYRNDVGTLDQSTVGLFRLVGRKLPAYVTEAKFTPDGRFVLCRQKGHKETVTVLDGNTFQTLPGFTVPTVAQPESLDTDGVDVWFGSEGRNSPLVRFPLPDHYRSAA